MDSHDLEDFTWLVSGAAESVISQVTNASDSLVGTTRSLRKNLSPSRARLVIELAELRRRARGKFVDSDRLFFTRKLLEQATDQWIAGYKATRFPQGGTIADLCCGMGGDLAALARTRHAIAVDLDPIACLIATANSRRWEIDASVVQDDVAEWTPETSIAAWHLDPDRRATGRKVTRLEACRPGAATIGRLLEICPAGAVKLAPATSWPDSGPWPAGLACEREWIGSGGECRQQVAWLGRLATKARRTATVVSRSGQIASVSGTGDEPIDSTASLSRYVSEPHAAVLAGRLQGALALKYGLAAYSGTSAYLTGDVLPSDALLQTFEVEEVLPLDEKRLRAALRDRGIGRLEIKHRGLPLAPDKLRRQLRLSGDETAVLLITVERSASQVVLARRLEPA